MKISRLIAIVIYLMNRDIVSASALAEKFEVSRRTIQRDIEALCEAGIPIASTYGSEGGYEILDTFRLQKGLIEDKDFGNIITALEGLCSAFPAQAPGHTLEKMRQLAQPQDRTIFLDLSASREGLGSGDFYEIEQAVRQKRPMRITYSSGSGLVTKRVIEPLALLYKWYAWYLFAYCRAKEDYRLFKVARVTSYEILDGDFGTPHPDVFTLLQRHEQASQIPRYNVLLKCANKLEQQVKEYLNGVIENREGDFFYYRMCMPVAERMWFSLLLGFGDQVEVIEPQALRDRIESHITALKKLY